MTYSQPDSKKSHLPLVQLLVCMLVNIAEAGIYKYIWQQRFSLRKIKKQRQL